jgi:hypothetical protein
MVDHQREVVNRRRFKSVVDVEASSVGIFGMRQQEAHAHHFGDLQTLQNEVLEQRGPDPFPWRRTSTARRAKRMAGSSSG